LLKDKADKPCGLLPKARTPPQPKNPVLKSPFKAALSSGAKFFQKKYDIFVMESAFLQKCCMPFLYLGETS